MMAFRFLGGLIGVLLVVTPLRAGAESQGNLDRVARDLASLEEDVQTLERSLRSEDLGRPRHIEERLTDAELLFNMQDYQRASVLYLDVVENYPRHPGFPEALYRLAECLFSTRNYYGARSRYREILDRAGQPIFREFVQHALGRLIEIAIRLNQFDGVQEYFSRLSQLPPAQVTSATHYARGRFHYHHEEYAAASRSFATVEQGAAEFLRAQYRSCKTITGKPSRHSPVSRGSSRSRAKIDKSWTSPTSQSGRSTWSSTSRKRRSVRTKTSAGTRVSSTKPSIRLLLPFLEWVIPRAPSAPSRC